MRSSTIDRRTDRGQIAISMSLDGTGRAEIDTGSDFLDHLLVGFTEYGRFFAPLGKTDSAGAERRESRGRGAA